MDCPLCNTTNDARAIQCALCDTVLIAEHQHTDAFLPQQEVLDSTELEPVDITSKYSINWKRLSILFVLLTLAVLPWLSNFDLLQVPFDVTQERENFTALMQAYQTKAQYWDMQKQNIKTGMHKHKQSTLYLNSPLVFNDISAEIFCSYLQQEAQFAKPQFHSVTLTPVKCQQEPRFLLTKKYNQWGPIYTVAALELALNTTVGRQQRPEFKSLRCGSRQLSPSLAWSYFAAELQALRCMEEFSSGIENFQVSFHNTMDAETNTTAPKFSWVYQQKSLGY